MPPAGEEVWGWFRELDCQRQGNGFGMNALGFREIKAWSDLRQVDLEPWQLDAIIALDLKRRAVAAEKTAPEKKTDDVSTRPLTSRLFDALFPAKKA
ncbi:MAG TPA: hypothetical protein VGO22_10820 [Pseudorhizobium sp.]|nr:hypothetical protein [Pseudorhizobium sp.]